MSWEANTKQNVAKSAPVGPVFITGDEEQRGLSKKLVAHVKAAGARVISSYDLAAGTNLPETIAKLIETCGVFVPLVTAEYITKAPGADEVAEAKRIKRPEQIFPLRARHCDLQGTALADVQCLPRAATVALETLADQDHCLRRIAEEIAHSPFVERLPQHGAEGSQVTLPAEASASFFVAADNAPATPIGSALSRGFTGKGIVALVVGAVLILALAGWVVTTPIRLARSFEKGEKTPSTIQAACEAKLPVACALHGVRLLSSGKSKEVREGFRLLEELCGEGQGDSVTCGHVAALLRKNKYDIPTNTKRAASIARIVCNRGDEAAAMACDQYSLLYRDGLTEEVFDANRFLQLRRLACQDSKAASCADYLHLLTKNQKDQPAAPATRRLADSMCKANVPLGCTWLGLFQQADGNEAAATISFQRACDAQDASGCDHLAMVLADSEKTSILNKACSLGAGRSCYNAGERLPKDAYAQRLKLFEAGCNLLDPFACNAAGYAFDMGLGTSKNPKEALDRYHRGCIGRDRLGNDPESCYNLGAAYEDGVGTAKNRDAARAFFKMACDGGFEKGCVAVAQSG